MDESDLLARHLYATVNLAAAALDHACDIARTMSDDEWIQALDPLTASVEDLRDRIDLGA